MQSSAVGLQKVDIVDSSSPLLNMVGVASGPFCTQISLEFLMFRGTHVLHQIFSTLRNLFLVHVTSVYLLVSNLL